MSESIPALIEVLERESRHRRQQMRSVFMVMGFAVAVYATLMFLNFLSGDLDIESIISFSAGLGGFAAFFGLTSAHQAALRVASQLQDPRLIPQLLEALDSDASSIKKEVGSALLRLLPQSKGLGLSLTPMQHHLLVKLTHSSDIPLQRAAIQALAWLGTAEALTSLDELSRTAPTAAGPLAQASAGEIRLRLARTAIVDQAADRLNVSE